MCFEFSQQIYERDVYMKKIQRIISVILVMVWISCILTGCSSNKASEYYNGIKWDSSVDEVKNKISDRYTESKTNPIITEGVDDFMGIEGIQVWLMYNFEGNKLTNISTPVVGITNDNLTREDVLTSLYDKFKDNYGECDEENENEYIWNKEDTKIVLHKNTIIEFLSK